MKITVKTDVPCNDLVQAVSTLIKNADHIQTKGKTGNGDVRAVQCNVEIAGHSIPVSVCIDEEDAEEERIREDIREEEEFCKNYPPGLPWADNRDFCEYSEKNDFECPRHLFGICGDPDREFCPYEE